MKFHLPWKKQKHLQRNCRPWYWQSAAKKGLWPAQPAACKKQRRPTGIIYPSPQIIPEQFDHLWRSKSLKRKEKDLLSHTGLFFFSSPFEWVSWSSFWAGLKELCSQQRGELANSSPSGADISPTSWISGQAAIITEGTEHTAMKPETDAGVSLGAQGTGAQVGGGGIRLYLV